jgi:ABC-type branched-subunit amino acid transport system ATPase component/ABC-type branched-subunit amino acid transport system permease subunit
MHLLGVSIGGWQISIQTVVIGTLTGLTYAILAAGLILVYRATKVINLAYGEIGVLGAAVLAKLVLDEHWPFAAALALVLVGGGLLGAAIELGVVRRLFKAPRLILLIATLGVAQVLSVGEYLLPGVHHTALYPSPLPLSLHIGGLVLGSADFMVIILVPITILGLAYFLNRTRYGLAIRASADNSDRALLAGISIKRVSTMVWCIAGILSTLSAVLIDPVQGTVVGLPTQALDPGLLDRALVVALIGGLTSLPLALAGGVGLGIVEAIMFANVSNPGTVDVVIFVVVLALVLLRRSRVGSEASGSWSLSPRVKAIPERLRELWWVRWMGPATTCLGLLIAVILPFVFTTAARNIMFSEILIFALIGLSVTVLTGWAGQLSLCQFAFVGLGAMTVVALHAKGVSFPIACVAAMLCGVVVAVLIGFPALRVQGLFLAVTTLAFAVAASGWFLSLNVFTQGQTVVYLPRTKIFGFLDLHSERTFYAVCLVVLIAACAGVSRLRSSGIGRTTVAVRDNEAAASSFALSPTVTKLTAFAISGSLAALAGALLAGLQVSFGPSGFSPTLSLQVVAMTVIGGLGSVAGAVIGAVYIIGLPALFNNSETVTLLTSGAGLLIVLLYLPGGLTSVAYRARDALLSFAAKRLPESPRPAHGGVALRALPERKDRPAAFSDSELALSAESVTVRFGGRLALDAVSVHARPGEVVGLIGSNGAGKSTLMNVVSGFITPAEGRLTVFGKDVTHMAAHKRAALGVGRVFQDARLFGDLTVRETVKLALEEQERARFVPTLLGLPSGRRVERVKSDQAGAYIDFLGLGRYADSFLSDLSTGSRRIVELCCLLAQGSRLLLLDEPTAGIAQRETESFGPLIRRVQAELGATIVIIEHDIPLIMSISDRIYCLAAGTQIAEGLPDQVRSDPKVIATYLGTDERAIARSGAAGAISELVQARLVEDRSEPDTPRVQ